MAPELGPIDSHHGAPESARHDHEIAFRERRGVLASVQLAVGVVVVAAIVVVIITAVIRAVG